MNEPKYKEGEVFKHKASQEIMVIASIIIWFDNSICYKISYGIDKTKEVCREKEIDNCFVKI